MNNNVQAEVVANAASAEYVSSVNPHMMGLQAVFLELAQTGVPVLLLAEAGAGRKSIARRIHELSPRAGQRFLAISCSSLVLENSADFEGEFCCGTVFLDELSELAKDAQRWLLRFLSPSKSEVAQSCNRARVICGSATDLESEVRSGNFREDLYYRLSGVCLRVPPLRQRREDIPLLVDFFLKKYSCDFGRPVPVLSESTRRLFREYSWPGNITELENAAKAIVVLGDESVAMGGLRARLSDGTGDSQVSLKVAARAASREREKEIILRALTRTRWNRRRAAQELQISYKALLYKLKQIGCSEYEAS